MTALAPVTPADAPAGPAVAAPAGLAIDPSTFSAAVPEHGVDFGRFAGQAGQLTSLFTQQLGGMDTYVVHNADPAFAAKVLSGADQLGGSAASYRAQLEAAGAIKPGAPWPKGYVFASLQPLPRRAGGLAAEVGALGARSLGAQEDYGDVAFVLKPSTLDEATVAPMSTKEMPLVFSSDAQVQPSANAPAAFAQLFTVRGSDDVSAGGVNDWVVNGDTLTTDPVEVEAPGVTTSQIGAVVIEKVGFPDDGWSASIAQVKAGAAKLGIPVIDRNA